MKQRIAYIDYAKGMGIILIMLAHCIQYFEPMTKLNKYVCSFHVPIFFIAAGCLAFYQRNKEIGFYSFVRKRSVALLIPYMIYSLFNSSIKFAVLFLKHSINSDAIKDELTALLITGNGTVWFLLTLFLVEIIYWCLKSVGGKNHKGLYIGVGLISIVVPYVLNGKLGDTFGIVLLRVVAGLGFYLIGYLIVETLEYLSKYQKYMLGIALFLTGTIISVVCGSKFSFFTGNFEKPVTSIFSSSLLSVGFILVMMLLQDVGERKLCRFKKMLDYFGENSLIVMVVHPTVLLLFTYPFAGKFWAMQGVEAIIVSIVLFCVIVLLEFPIIWIVNRWFSWTLGKKKKVG